MQVTQALIERVWLAPLTLIVWVVLMLIRTAVRITCRTARTDFRLWVWVARTWTIVTTSDNIAMTAAYAATNVPGSTADLHPITRSRATGIL
jgi:hypothetical protein